MLLQENETSDISGVLNDILKAFDNKDGYILALYMITDFVKDAKLKSIANSLKDIYKLEKDNFYLTKKFITQIAKDALSIGLKTKMLTSREYMELSEKFERI